MFAKNLKIYSSKQLRRLWKRKNERLIKRLEAIARSVQETNVSQALLALGSCGLERDRLDIFSDLDSFVIVEDGHKGEFINSLNWLSNVKKKLHFLIKIRLMGIRSCLRTVFFANLFFF